MTSQTAQTAKVDAAHDDPYVLALVANALLHRPINGNREAAIAILERLAATHLKNGSVDGAKTSITCSGGRDSPASTIEAASSTIRSRP